MTFARFVAALAAALMLGLLPACEEPVGIVDGDASGASPDGNLPDQKDAALAGDVGPSGNDGSVVNPNDGSVVTPDDAGTVIFDDAGTIISDDGGTVLPPDAGTVIFDDAGTVIPPDAGAVIPPDAGTELPSDGGTVIPPDGGTVIPPDAGTIIPPDAGAIIPPDAGAIIPPDAGTIIPPDGGTPPCPGGCPSGQRCVNNACTCDAVSCPTGCCDTSGACQVGQATACGTGGGGCQTCDPTSANACVNGTCGCGTGGACNADQRCDSATNSCVCDSTTCSGCCTATAAGTCITTVSHAQCGRNGAVCQACGIEADNCDNGTCACGNPTTPDPACATGQVCMNGLCECNAASCPAGCCNGSTCVTALTAAACGTGGAACFTCPAQADSCTAGVCTCGAGSVCLTTQFCVDGACQGSCQGFGQPCGGNSACCSNNCVSGKCAVPVGSCNPGGASCTASTECCSKQCEVQVDGVKRCSGIGQCLSAGATCDASTDCCSLYCDPATLTCSIAAQCKVVGASCASPVECCSGQCTANECSATSTNCKSLGEDCASGSCCSTVCLGTTAKRCSFYNFCRAQSDVCFADADCCSGHCNTATKLCYGTTGNTPTDEPCSGSCANTMCVPTLGGATSYCYPIGGCRVQEDYCEADSDCCSGLCFDANTSDPNNPKTCKKNSACLASGEVCGGLGSSTNCCTPPGWNKKDEPCRATSLGIKRCFATPPSAGDAGVGACFANGAECHISDECCSGIYIPDDNSSTGYYCAAACIPLNDPTQVCTTTTDCCSPGVCQAGVCKDSGTDCFPLGADCDGTKPCCEGSCFDGQCSL